MAVQSILLVDDNEADHFLHEAVIKKQFPNAEVLKAYDGAEALKLIEQAQQKPDFILLDINMPGMNGFDFLEAYHNKELDSSIVVMISSSIQQTDKDKALQYDCVKGYFMKPLDSSDLEMLQQLL